MQNLGHALRLFIRRYALLFLLLGLTLWTRYLMLKDGVIPFSFDHGKDSLAIMDMWLNRDPKLIGPWTSIPGLFFGPAWYYLLLPFYILFAGSPLGAVWAMVALVLLQIVLAYKLLGRLEAILITGSAFFMTISTSAWNPFPMALLSLVILIILKQLAFGKQLGFGHAFLLASAAALGFHFSTAFALLYPILIGLSLWRRRVAWNWRNLLGLGLGFVWPFVPQVVFELRHDFVESRAILNYLLHGEASSWSLDKLAIVFSTLVQEIKHFIIPNLTFPKLFTTVVAQVLLALVFGKILLHWHRRTLLERRPFYAYLSMPFEYGLWIIVPLLYFSLLHFNVWYLYALAPLFIMILADVLRIAPKRLTVWLLLIFLIAPLVKVNYFVHREKEELRHNARFLPKQLEIIAHLRDLSKNEPFSVYHYANDVYDFSYQYLYFYQALQGQKLPVEFAYRLHTDDYVTQKPALLAYFRQHRPSVFFDASEPNYYFYLIEKPILQRLLDEWWTRVPRRTEFLLGEHPYTKDLVLNYEVNYVAE